MKKQLPYMVWLTKPEMTVILDALDFLAGFYATRKSTHANEEIMGDIREKLVLARYGKIKKTEMSAIRNGRRVPNERRSERHEHTKQLYRLSAPQRDIRPRS